jgi:hypothetical protein
MAGDLHEFMLDCYACLAVCRAVGIHRDHRASVLFEALRRQVDALDDQDNDIPHSDLLLGCVLLLGCLQDAVHPLLAMIALLDRLRAWSNADTKLPWLAQQHEPEIPLPSRVSRSEPDLALAPPLPCVALLSDDVTAVAA